MSVRNIIKIVRGDSFEAEFKIIDSTKEAFNLEEPYKLTDNDILYFAIMLPNQKFEDAIIRKKYLREDTNDDGYFKVTLSSEDTEKLLPGTYYYCSKLRKNVGFPNEEVKTNIHKTKLIILD